MEQKWHFEYLNAHMQATNKWLFTEIMGSIISNNKHIQEHPGRLTDSLQTEKRLNTSIQLLAVDYSRSSNNSPLSPWACIRCCPKLGWWWKLPLYHYENPQLKGFCPFVSTKQKQRVGFSSQGLVWSCFISVVCRYFHCGFAGWPGTPVNFKRKAQNSCRCKAIFFHPITIWFLHYDSKHSLQLTLFGSRKKPVISVDRWLVAQRMINGLPTATLNAATGLLATHPQRLPTTAPPRRHPPPGSSPFPCWCHETLSHHPRAAARRDAHHERPSSKSIRPSLPR